MGAAGEGFFCRTCYLYGLIWTLDGGMIRTVAANVLCWGLLSGPLRLSVAASTHPADIPKADIQAVYTRDDAISHELVAEMDCREPRGIVCSVMRYIPNVLNASCDVPPESARRREPVLLRLAFCLTVVDH